MTSQHPYLPVPARIESIVDECGGPRQVKTFGLRLDGAALRIRPGQCVQLSVMGVGEIFVAVASPPECSVLELSILRVGKVTTALHQLGEGDCVGIRGPYGNGFPVEEWIGHDLILLGGGIGYAPLRSLLGHVLARRGEFGSIAVFHGARSPADMLYRQEFARLEGREDLDLYLAVDWPQGEQGPIDRDAEEGWHRVNRADPKLTRPPKDRVRFTGYLPEVLAAVAPNAEQAIAVTCGPPVMIRLVVQQLQALGLSAEQIFTTLERRMKCGIGLCGRCNLGPVFVCTDGPVFSHATLLDLPEAFA